MEWADTRLVLYFSLSIRLVLFSENTLRYPCN